MTARVLMVQGCASGVGKSLITAGLCRLFRRRGLSVAPFKAQNLALNSFVTRSGGEIGRATAVQAEAAGVEPTVDMNPLLLKPEGGAEMQVVLLGEALERGVGRRLYSNRAELAGVVEGALARLRARHDLILIEGAGSPAEINLRGRDIVNMHIARAADAPVLLVGDVERGGVFAHLYGTLELLEPADRAHIAALVINRFHGDEALIRPGIEQLEALTRLPVLGVVPHIPGLQIADEDSADLDRRPQSRDVEDQALRIAVIRFPQISNHDDLQPLEHEPGVAVQFVDRPAQLEGADLVILPGTKNTRADLGWLIERGFADVLRDRARSGLAIHGICGGYQMLGREIRDDDGVEGPAGRAVGLGCLPITTQFGARKTTVRRRLRVHPGAATRLFDRVDKQHAFESYEIHMGAVQVDETARMLFHDAQNGSPEGVVAGSVSGSLQHGLFHDAALRRSVLAGLLGHDALENRGALETTSASFERLADTLELCLDMPRITGWIDPVRPWSAAETNV